MGNAFSDFLQKAGMYETIEITKDNANDLHELIGGRIRISEYCPICKESRVFIINPVIANYRVNGKLENNYLENLLHDITLPGPGYSTRGWSWNLGKKDLTRIMHFHCQCTMDNSHHIDYVVLNEKSNLMKIGQYPTVADLSFPNLDEVRRVIDKDSIGELRRAIGLYAHGIGVGSFVYLRRIFERIINQARNEAEKDGLSIPDFDRITMQDKVRALKDYLPNMISSNAAIYSIVSKGIHELSEEECKRYFPILRDSILLILKKWAQRRNEAEAEELLNKSINAINSELSK